jgi:hypothetical protein
MASVPTVALAACALCWLTPVQGFGGSAEIGTGYFFPVRSQLFDATPIGGELRTLAPAVTEALRDSAAPAVKAQIFDPEVLGAVRSRFGGARSVSSRSDASQPTIEGRSIGTPDQQAPPIIETSPRQPPECESRPSAGKAADPQFGSLEPDQQAG